MVYQECTDCIAHTFCKIFNGEVDPPNRSWCNAHYRLYKALRLSNIPKKYIEANLDAYVCTEYNKSIYGKYVEYVNNIVDYVKNGLNLYLYGGGYGTGKTFHGVMLLNHYIYKKCLTNDFDFEHPISYYVSYPDLVDVLRYEKQDSHSVIETLNNVPLLLMDDIGAGTFTDYSREQTYIIINNRWANGLSTIYTSNVMPDVLSDDSVLGGRIVSRITANCIGFEFKGKDMRRKH